LLQINLLRADTLYITKVQRSGIVRERMFTAERTHLPSRRADTVYTDNSSAVRWSAALNTIHVPHEPHTPEQFLATAEPCRKRLPGRQTRPVSVTTPAVSGSFPN